MDALGVALVVAGVVIACGALASLAVIALIALEPWSRLRPHYQRGGTPERQPTPTLAPLGGAVAGSGAAVLRKLADRRGRRPTSRHPRGARHLLPLVHAR